MDNKQADSAMEKAACEYFGEEWELYSIGAKPSMRRAFNHWSAGYQAHKDEQPEVDGLALIAAERKRQIEVEGWTPEHDDEHETGELAKAAAVYALLGTGAETISRDGRESAWPWSPSWFKPSDRIRDLSKAGALIAAEIDRINRRA